MHCIPTDLAISCPNNTYGRIAPRSGLTIKKRLDIRAGVVDNDYRGNIMVAMQNVGEEVQQIKEGDKITIDKNRDDDSLNLKLSQEIENS